VLSSAFFDRQVVLYEQVLEAGAARGAFDLAAPAGALARGIVAMKDGLGPQVVIGHPGLDSAEAERILLRHASAVTGAELE
jgi:hypothetical protein